MSTYDAPNQQVVRADGSGPGVGMEGEPPEPEGLDAMTKAQLLEHANDLGLADEVDDSMTKTEIREAIDAA